MKKIILNASLAVIISAGAISAAHADPFKGFYATADLGLQKNKFKSKVVGTGVKAKQKMTVPIGASFGFSSVASNNIYTAFEGGLGATFRSGGAILTPSLTAKVGYRFHERFVLAGTASGSYNKYRFNNSLGRNLSKSKFGFAPGVEGIIGLNDKMTLRLGYQYNMKNRIIVRDPVQGKTKFDVTGHKLSAKLGYQI
ncbi:MAG: porin family protein [Alphaproteobacteria bacterium]|nr:porin family protein [Alphaproteobacteria bacterium]